MNDTCLHRFTADVSGIDVPRQFTFPFHYVPHPLARLAAGQVRAEAGRHGEWREELDGGKMLGVLVVRDTAGALGFLAAYSGVLAGRNDHPYFVPPVYNLLQPEGEFRRGEAEITMLNRRIDDAEHSVSRARMKEQLAITERERDNAIAACRALMAEAKARRRQLRASGALTPGQAEALTAESQHQNGELKRLRQRHDALVDEARHQLDASDSHINALRRQRRAMSEALQRRIFSLFVVENALGERRTLLDIFAPILPPAGAGECCGPKLLHYAYLHHLAPVCMAEFWWGASPVGEVRHDGHFYAACRGKCHPILSFMMQGLDVEANPLSASAVDTPLRVIYDDAWIAVVDKPAGLLVEPGTVSDDNIVVRFRLHYPTATGPIIVHRLDQETSGLLILAKNKAAHKAFQALFAERRVEKAYIALAEGTVGSDAGTISLPLRPDIDDRPRQMVDFDHGKPAVTRYEVIGRNGNRTRLRLFPLTGRTHQLRVHLSHPQGLGHPIVGDMLYGTADSRLMLHAARLSFTHPFTGEPTTISSPPPF